MLYTKDLSGAGTSTISGEDAVKRSIVMDTQFGGPLYSAYSARLRIFILTI